MERLTVLGKIAGIILIVFGLHTMGALRIGWLSGEMRMQTRRKPAGLFGALIVGAVHSIAQTKDGQPAVCKLKVTGMTCGGCEGAVKLAAKRVDGVKSVTVSYKTGWGEHGSPPQSPCAGAILSRREGWNGVERALLRPLIEPDFRWCNGLVHVSANY
jgi:hypothetical protein